MKDIAVDDVFNALSGAETRASSEQSAREPVPAWQHARSGVSAQKWTSGTL
ncbi:hypothetical protein J2W46_005826 [Paraburkholderia strydomiana]|nr:hypothetical protein [Paraburkholderia strydomiana]